MFTEINGINNTRENVFGEELKERKKTFKLSFSAQRHGSCS